MFADSGLAAEPIEPTGRAVVKTDFLAVYSSMTKESAVVKFLKKGEVVTIEFEIEGEKGAWCVITEQGDTFPTGHVQCRHLEREEPPGPIWEKVEKPTAVEPPPEEPTPVPLEGEPEGEPAQPFIKHFPPVVKPPPPLPVPPDRPGKCIYTSRKDRPAILNAAIDGSIETVNSLLGHLDIVKIFLANGADIHARNYDIGCPPLTWAATKGHIEIAEVLLEAGAYVNLECMLSGEGALSAAAKEGNTDILRALLDRGADVNGKNKLGETALWWAREKGHKDIVRLLKEAGAKE
jgi:hypothetical protein